MKPQVFGLLNSPWKWIWISLSALVLTALAWWVYSFFRDRRIAKLLKEGPESKTQRIEGMVIHYERFGRGPHLVLLHGIGASTYTWRRLVPLLAPNFTLTVVDIPGFGRSSKRPEHDHGLDEQSRVLTEFLDRIGIEKASLVGSSMGGAIALWMAKRHPDRFRKVAVLSPAVNPKVLPIELARFSRFFLSPTQLAVNHQVIKLLARRVVSKKSLVTDEVVRNYQRPYLEDPKAIQTFIRATKVLSDSRLPAELKTVEAEVLVLYGKKDQLVSSRSMRELLEVLPRSQYEEHPKAGHHPMEDHPEWVAERLQSFF